MYVCLCMFNSQRLFVSCFFEGTQYDSLVDDYASLTSRCHIYLAIVKTPITNIFAFGHSLSLSVCNNFIGMDTNPVILPSAPHGTEFSTSIQYASKNLFITLQILWVNPGFLCLFTKCKVLFGSLRY